MTDELEGEREDGGGRLARTAARGKAASARAAGWAETARTTHASVDIGLRVVDKDRRLAAAVLAGGIAYRFFFWFLALGLFAGGALGFFDAADVTSAASGQGLGAVLADAVGDATRSSHTARWWLVVLGGWLLLWTGYMAAKALVLVHASVWGLPPQRVGNPVVASLVFSGAATGFLAAMAGARWVRAETEVGGLVVTLALVAIPFTAWLAVSQVLPHRARSWRDLVPGAAVVAVGVQALNLFTAFFLGPRLASATALYGGLGIATTILFWLYVTGRLMVGSAVLNVAAGERTSGSDPT